MNGVGSIAWLGPSRTVTSLGCARWWVPLVGDDDESQGTSLSQRNCPLSRRQLGDRGNYVMFELTDLPVAEHQSELAKF